ncbi:MAG: glycosyltransferase family 4 protein [Pseudomonadota bacterium]
MDVPPPTHASLLDDSAGQVAANPVSRSRWHTLYAHYTEAADASAKARVRQRLLAQVAAGGVAGYFRATFLAAVTGEAAYTSQAAQIALKLKPFDAERLASLVHLEWGCAVAAERSHHGFVQRLRAARLPALIRCLGDALERSAGATLAARPVSAPRRVALLANYLGGSSHPPTVMAISHAALLQAQGVEVRLFSCQEIDLPAQNDYAGHPLGVLLPSVTPAQLGAMVPQGLTVTLSDARFSLMRRWRDMLAQIALYDPDLVLFVGFCSPLLAPLYAARPVLGLCVHGVPPLAPVDCWLASDRARHGIDSQDWGSSLPPARGYHYPFRTLMQAPGPPAPRTPGRTVLLTVGARLVTEIDGDWAARMVELLRRDSSLVWLLVGGAGALPPALAGVPPAQLQLLAHRQPVDAVFAQADIYLNPARLGGGISVAEAMAAGLPVLALDGSDGGHKLGELGQASQEAYFTELAALIADPARRRRMGAAMRERYVRTLDLAQAGPALLTAAAAAIARFGHRKRD